MSARHFPSGRFGYAMGFMSYEAASEALSDMIAEGEMSVSEGRIEPYDAGNGGHAKRISRWAITTE